jgi:hypothetical protein
MVRKERRKHKRALLEVPLDLEDVSGEAKGVRAKTVNLSAGGFYCRIPYYVPVLTKLKISIVVPVTGAAGKQEDHVISCEGMVVRTVPEKASPDVSSYEIGCFFTEMSDYDRMMIEQYLSERAAL